MQLVWCIQYIYVIYVQLLYFCWMQNQMNSNLIFIWLSRCMDFILIWEKERGIKDDKTWKDYFPLNFMPK